MKKPNNWNTLPVQELTEWIHKLNIHACSISYAGEGHSMPFYKQEIAPLVKRRDQLWSEWLNKTDH